MEFTKAEFYLEEERSKHEIVKEVKINTLPECEMVKDWYVIRMFDDGHSSVYTYRRSSYLKPCISDDKHIYWRYRLVRNDGNYRNLSLHRLVALAFMRESYDPDNGVNVVNHIDLERPPEVSTLDNRLFNLEWVTQSQNNDNKKRRANKYYIPDENRPDESKYNIDSVKEQLKDQYNLTSDAVTLIFDMYEDGYFANEIASKLGCKVETIYNLINGKTWTDHPRSIKHFRDKVIEGFMNLKIKDARFTITKEQAENITEQYFRL